MRLLIALVLFALSATLDVSSASAQIATTCPWRSTASEIGRECTHPSRAERLFDVQGIGDGCSPNSAFQGQRS